MSGTWYGDAPPDVPLGALGLARAVLKGIPIFGLVFGGLLLLLVLRCIERPLFGLSRPMTPYLTVVVCRGTLALMGLRLDVKGRPLKGRGAVVANHSSWLDIFVLNASKRIYFVSKAEVANWPGIGWLARATGTVFIERDRTKAAQQAALFKTRLGVGHKLLFFPEGTSSDGARVLPFKSTLFAAFFDPALRDTLKVQPVSVAYTAPHGQDARFFGWWGDMEFGNHFLRVLAYGAGGRIGVTYHEPLAVSAFPDRKALAAACELTVRGGCEAAK